MFYRFAVEITKLVEYTRRTRAKKAVENAAKKEVVVNGMKQFRAFLDKLVQTAGNGVLGLIATGGNFLAQRIYDEHLPPGAALVLRGTNNSDLRFHVDHESRHGKRCVVRSDHRANNYCRRGSDRNGRRRFASFTTD